MSQRLSRHASDITDAARHTLLELGHVLRETRQARGEDLYGVASRLRIKPSYLYALEQGDLALTPGRTYALGFLRSYAEHLGFDGHEVVEHVKGALDATTPVPELHYRTPIAERTRPSGFVLGLSIVLAAAVYGAWHVYFRDQPVLERVAAVPGELGRIASGILDLDHAAPATSAPVARRGELEPPATPPAGTIAASPTPRAGPATPPADPVGPVAAPPSRPLDAAIAVAEVPGGRMPSTPLAPPIVPPTQASAAAPPQTDPTALVAPAQVAAAGEPERPPSARELLAALAIDAGSTLAPEAARIVDGDGRIVLVASEPSWIQVRSGDREFVKTKTMEAGERIALPNRDDLALWTGNAGGLEILVDGRSVGPLGQRGRVLRDVPLAPEAVKARFAPAR